MPDAKRWIEDITRVEPPELWGSIEGRARQGTLSSPPPRTSRPLLAALVLAVSVVVVGGVLYAMRPSDQPTARGPSPSEIIRYPLEGPPQPLAVGNGAVWVKVGAGDGTERYLARIDTATGTIERLDVPGEWPAVSGSSVWLLCNGCEGSILQLDPETGSEVRRIALPDRGGQVAGVEDGVWVTTDAGVVFVDETGAVTRSFRLANADLLGADGDQLWVSTGGGVTSLDPTSGTVRAQVEFSDVCTMDVAADMVWIASCEGRGDEDELVGIDATTGEVMFRRSLEGWGQMRYANGVLWLAQNDPQDERRLRVLRFDPRSGAEVGTPIVVPRGEPRFSILASFPPHVFFDVGEGSLWLTDFTGGDVIRLPIPIAAASGIVGDLRYVGGPTGGPYGPEPGRLVAYSPEGDEVGSVDFAEGERFRLALAPGTYRLVFTSGDAGCPETTVTVSAGAFEDASVRCSVR